MKFDPVDVHVGHRLRQTRTSHNMSMEALGKRVGVSYQQIQKYENGRDRMSASTLFRIARLLHLRIEWFFEEFDDIPSASTRDAETIRAAAAVGRMDPAVRREVLGLIEALDASRDERGA